MDELARYREFLNKDDPLVNAILKGHLILESLLEDILRSLTDRGDLLLNAADSFHRKRLVAQAHAGNRSKDESWKLIQQINSLRNEIAHSLEADKSERLFARISEILQHRDATAFQLIPNPKDKGQLVSHTVSYLIGFLQAYRRGIAL